MIDFIVENDYKRFKRLQMLINWYVSKFKIITTEIHKKNKRCTYTYLSVYWRKDSTKIIRTRSKWINGFP